MISVPAHQRHVLNIPVHINIANQDIAGSLLHIDAEGLKLLSDVVLSPGTPLALEFSIAQFCYLNVSAQVACSLSVGISGKHAVQIKFSATRTWERSVLESCIQQLEHYNSGENHSFLRVVVWEDKLAVELAALYPKSVGHKQSASKGARLRKSDLIPRQKRIDYTLEATQARREWLTEKTGAELKHMAVFSEDPLTMRGNIENLIGVAHVPIGIAGPLCVNGQFAQGTFYVPMATTEGALIYTCNQGMLTVSLAGGATTSLLKDELHIAPAFTFDSVKMAEQFVTWLEQNFQKIKETAENTTRYGKLLKLEPHIFDRNVVVKFCYSTGDAMGINMITFATEEACKLIVSTVRPERYYLQANFSSIKKVTAHNFITGFGKTVVAEVIVPGSLIKRIFGVTAEEVVSYYQLVRLATAHAGMLGITGHTANAIEGLFIACGQDVACVVDSYIGVTNFEVTKDRSLYVSVKLPCLLVGTVGGGTDLATQRECLGILDCYGAGRSKKFSEIVAATVLSGELGICARVANGTFADAHRKYGRKSGKTPFIATQVSEK